MAVKIFKRQVVRATQTVKRGLQHEELVFCNQSEDTDFEVDQVLSMELDLAEDESAFFDLTNGALAGDVVKPLVGGDGEPLRLSSLKFLSIVSKAPENESGEAVPDEVVVLFSNQIYRLDNYGGDVLLVADGEGVEFSNAATNLRISNGFYPRRFKILLGGSSA